MTTFIKCNHCEQNNYADALCCQWCGAPMPIPLLKVRDHGMYTYGGFGLYPDCSTAMPMTMCSPSEEFNDYFNRPLELDHDERVREIKADEEARRAWSEGYELADPPKRGWREWLGIGDR